MVFAYVNRVFLGAVNPCWEGKLGEPDSFSNLSSRLIHGSPMGVVNSKTVFQRFLEDSLWQFVFLKFS